MGTGKKIINLAFAPVIIIAAVAFTVMLVKSKKKPPSRPPGIAVPVVTVIESVPGDTTPVVSTYGYVRTYFETNIAGQVGGLIESISPDFDPGRALKKGDLLAKIEDSDFKTALAERQSALAQTLQTLADEETRSRIASEDWLASGRKLEDAPEFTLRMPQLTAAKASVSSAEEAVDKALLDLTRTEIRSPFDAIVQARTASPGNVVSAGATLGTLVSRDKAEVRLPLTPNQVAQLDLPLAFTGGGSSPVPATLRSPSRPGVEWQASVTRTEAAIDTKNQVLFVIAEIPHPFDDPDAFLPVGTFVTAELAGRPLNGVHTLPESTLLDDSFLWVVGPEGELLRQPASRLSATDGIFQARIEAPVTPLPLQVIARPLASFREGMKVEIAEKQP